MAFGAATFATLMNELGSGKEGGARFAMLVGLLSIETGIPNLSVWLNNVDAKQVHKFASLLNSVEDQEVAGIAIMLNMVGSALPKSVARSPDVLLKMMAELTDMGAEGLKRAVGSRPQGTSGCSVLVCVMVVIGIGIAVIA